MIGRVEKPTYVYYLYGRSDRLLYIGVSQNLRQRRYEHSISQRWWRQVRRWRLVGPFPNRAVALVYEREQIRALQPPQNTVHTHRMNLPRPYLRRHRSAVSA